MSTEKVRASPLQNQEYLHSLSIAYQEFTHGLLQMS